MNPNERKAIPLTEEEKKSPIAKYYKETLAVPNPKLMQILAQGSMDPALAITPDQIEKMYEPGYMEGETGYCILPNGAGYVAVNNVFPGCTIEMMQWWMAWHPLEQIRYRIWNPVCHPTVAIADCDRDYILDPNVPLGKKSQNVVHFVIEDIGGGPQNILIHFLDHGKMNGIDDEKLAATHQTLFGGYGIVSDATTKKGVLNKAPAIMMHFCRETEEGVEFRTRFWVGYRWNKGIPMCVLPHGVKVPEVVPMGLAFHNVEEYSHLASILPDVYREFGHLPLDSTITA